MIAPAPLTPLVLIIILSGCAVQPGVVSWQEGHCAWDTKFCDPHRIVRIEPMAPTAQHALSLESQAFFGCGDIHPNYWPLDTPDSVINARWTGFVEIAGKRFDCSKLWTPSDGTITLHLGEPVELGFDQRGPIVTQGGISQRPSGASR